MSQIKKAQDGIRLTTLQQENDELLQSPDISQELKNKAMAIIDFSQEVIRKEQFQPRDLTLYQTGIAQSVNNLLKGKKYYNPTQTGYADTNIFGYYNKRRELPFLVNETVKQVENSNLSNNNIDDSGVIVKTRIIPDLSSGFNSYVTDTLTNDERTKRFATWLGDKLGKISYTDNDIVQGISADILPNLPKYANTLKKIGQQGLINKENLKTIGQIVSNINNPELTKLFENWFQVEDGYIFGKPEEDQGARVVLGDQEYSLVNYNNDSAIGKYLLDKGYSTIKDQDGNYILLDGDKERVKGLEYIELDPTSTYYKNAILTDDQGKVIFGNLTDEDFQKQIGTRLENIKRKIIEENQRRYPILDYSNTGEGKGVDLNKYFTDGYRTLFSLPEGFDYEKDLWFPYESIDNWDELKEQFSYAPITTNTPYRSYSPIQSPTNFYTPEEIVTQFGENTNNYGDINGTKFWGDYTFNYLLTGNKGSYSGDPKEFTDKLVEFVRLYTLATLLDSDPDADQDTKQKYIDQLEDTFTNDTVKTSNGHQLGFNAYNQLKTQKPEYFKYLLYEAIKKSNGDDKVRLVNFYNDQIVSMKEGGILKMFEGGGTKNISSEINRATQKESNQNTQPLKETKLTNDQKKAIAWMATSLVNDIALMFNPEPWSSLAQSVYGIGADARADSLLGVPTRAVIGNALNNAGFGALSMIPAVGNYTQSAKVAKAAAKFGKAIKIAGATTSLTGIGLNFPELQGTIDKVLSGNTDTFSAQDFRNLYTIATTLLSGGTGIVKNAKHKIPYKTTTDTFIPVTIGGKKTHVKVSAEELAQLQKTKAEKEHWYDLLNLKNRNKNREAYTAKLKELNPDQNIESVIFNNGFMSEPSRFNTRTGIEVDEKAASTLLSRQAANKHYYSRATNPYELPEYNPSAPWFNIKNPFTPKGPKVTTGFNFKDSKGKKVSVYLVPSSEKRFLEGSESARLPEGYTLIDPANRVTPEQLKLLNGELLQNPKYGKKYFIISDKSGGKLEKLNKYIENGRKI